MEETRAVLSALRYQCFSLPPLESNCYLVWCPETNAAAVIDPGPDPENVLTAAADHRLEIGRILATHGHYDHVAGAERIRQVTGAPVHLHAADFSMARKPGSEAEWVLGFSPPGIEPDSRLKSGEAMSVGRASIKVVETPGHTPGSVCFLCGDLFFSGDTLFAGSVGRTDLPGGEPERLQQSLRRILALPDNIRVLPGHGPETTIGFERSHNPFLLE